jgi:4-hydroxythreonine-4-phosphate dehydrogenase
MNKTPPYEIAITMGDPAGIGPEIICRAIAKMTAEEQNRCLLIGDTNIFADASVLTNSKLEFCDVGTADRQVGAIAVANIQAPADQPIVPGQISAAAGDMAFRCVKEAVRQVQTQQASVIVTAPLNKAALHAAGHHYDGHTGMLAALTKAESSFMLLASEKLSTLHVSTHVALKEAITRMTPQRIIATVLAGHAHLRKLGLNEPNIAVAGLNPHCGEGGIFGSEDKDIIAPAVTELQSQGLKVTGPISADTVFYRASQGEFDLVIAQYHDQGHVPMKLIAFETTVNVSLGLPVQRTSVDHGTAFDIAWKGIADATNLGEAIAYARRLASHAEGD